MSNPLYGQLVEPAYRTGLAQRPLADLRAMRLECEHAEAAVSFTRRVLHGRLDILSGERQRRAEGAPRPAPVAGEPSRQAEDLADLIERMPTLLADKPASGGGRASRMLVSAVPDCVEDDLVQLVDDVVGPATLSSLGDLSDERVAELEAGLFAVERDLSSVRHELHLSLDALKEEITRRYQSGEVSPDGLFS